MEGNNGTDLHTRRGGKGFEGHTEHSAKILLKWDDQGGKVRKSLPDYRDGPEDFH